MAQAFSRFPIASIWLAYFSRKSFSLFTYLGFTFSVSNIVLLAGLKEQPPIVIGLREPFVKSRKKDLNLHRRLPTPLCYQVTPFLVYSLGGRLRSCDLSVPNRTRYQTSLHLDIYFLFKHVIQLFF
jgi:hypothetical protein